MSGLGYSALFWSGYTLRFHRGAFFFTAVSTKIDLYGNSHSTSHLSHNNLITRKLIGQTVTRLAMRPVKAHNQRTKTIETVKTPIDFFTFSCSNLF